MIYGWPLPKRMDLIKKLLTGQSIEGQYPIRFQGSLKQFNVYNVPLNMPKYRLANGRTQAAQEEYLANHPELQPDFFRRDLELDQAQKIQHELLTKMVSEKGLLEHFKTNEQEYPLVLTDFGFIVNGNRRLCAMRILFEKNQNTFSRFENTKVVFLPTCTEKDIDELEAYEQIREDIKADYTWITWACMLRKKREVYSDEDLARLYDTKKPEIQQSVNLLELADIYLNNRNKPHQYHLVEKAEFAFKKLLAGRKTFRDEGERDIFEKVCYCLLDDSSDQGRRLYEAIPQVQQYLPKVIEKLKAEVYSPGVHEPIVKQSDILGSSDFNDLSEIAKVVNDQANYKKISDIVRDVIEGERAIEREKQNANYVLKLVTEASTRLSEAVLGITPPITSKTGVVEQLSSIEHSIKKLKEWLAKK